MPRQKREQNPRKMPPTRGNPERRIRERRSGRTPKCRNINSPRQFNTQRCNATKKKSHGDGKIIPLMSKCGRKGSAKERAEIAEKGLEGDEQCRNAERMDETVV